MKIGLCAACENVRVTGNRRGSRFYLCALSEHDPRFPRYPRLPVLECDGFRPKRNDPEPDVPDGDSSG